MCDSHQQPCKRSDPALHCQSYEYIPLDLSQGQSLSWAINQSNTSATSTAIVLLCLPTTEVDASGKLSPRVLQPEI